MSAQPTPSRTLRDEAILGNPLVRELLDARLIAVLTTLEPDGSVHAVPLWYAVDGEAIVFGCGSRSRKIRNLRRDPRATVVLHDSRAGAEVCGASIGGRAEVVEGVDALPLVRLVHSRYVAPGYTDYPEAAEFLGSDDVAVRFLPERAVTWDERGSPAARVLRESGAALPLTGA